MHGNIALRFTTEDGSPARIDPRTGNRFTSAEDMDEYMIECWNSVVKPKDRVCHLGDFCMPRKGLQILHRLNGRINMVLGNHDPWKKKDWEQFKNIDQIYGVRMFPKLGWVCTHIPVHECQLQGRWTHNIHGHLHNNRITKTSKREQYGDFPKGIKYLNCINNWYVNYVNVPDKRYFNVSVEQLNYIPISLEELKDKLDA